MAVLRVGLGASCARRLKLVAATNNNSKESFFMFFTQVLNGDVPIACEMKGIKLDSML
jgi:hypothetical protein